MNRHQQVNRQEHAALRLHNQRWQQHLAAKADIPTAEALLRGQLEARDRHIKELELKLKDEARVKQELELKLKDEKRAKQKKVEQAEKAAADAVNIAKALANRMAADGGIDTVAAVTDSSFVQLLHLVPAPALWEPCQAEENIKFVCLPWGDTAEEEGADTPETDHEAEAMVKQLVENGFARHDAEAALKHCQGDLTKACDFIAETSRRGGAARVSRLLEAEASFTMEQLLLWRSSIEADAAAAAANHELKKRKEQVQRQALREEVEMVAQRWAEGTGLSKEQITRIERVQNRLLWSKFCLRRAEVEHSAGTAEVNEKMLWHGSSHDVLLTICNEGFDHRVSNMSGALGAGVYFATDASYSMNYSMKGGRLGPMVTGAHTQDLAMLLCRVVIGRSGNGFSGLRKPPAGADSVMGGAVGMNPNYAVFDNSQAYPEYLVFYKQN